MSTSSASLSGAHSPVIGIPVRLSITDAPGADLRVAAAARTFAAVVDLVGASGATPEVLLPGAGLQEQLARCTGFVVPGGGDVDPALYGGPVDHPALYDVNQEQDALDLAVIRHALAVRLPLLGICRGTQLINVAHGGTLHLDLAPGLVQHNPPTGTSWALHNVGFVAGSVCAEVYSAAGVPVASAHHQAIDRVGQGLQVTARAADGCVEAVEAAQEGAGWLVGVQWHPEAEVPEPALRAPLFEALREAAALVSVPC
ncbi:gamma-glutamyl-gamma-aminobutyrate hydrolase family protein [Streptomyces shenzhenensis]|uniref:gamma-glutamyl-gamma-aminobutyrate hydrolase family protein n=1 Tax=Streptomyces shenzhenensis TaxID=943815 RepID=UPI003D8EB9CB